MLSVPPHQFAEGADELVVHQAVHVDLLVLVLQAGQASDVGVRHRLHQPVAGERLLVGVRRAQAAVAVRHFARDARLHGLARRVLLAELAADARVHLGHHRRAVVGVGVVDVVGVVGVRVGVGVGGSGRAAAGAASTRSTPTAAKRSGYRPANGGGVGPLRLQAAALGGGIGAAEGGFLKAVNNVLQRHIALQALQPAVIQRDDVATGGALKGRDGLERFAGGAVGHQDTVSAVETQAVGARQEQGVFKQLQADRAGQLRLQCFHLQLNRSKGDIKSHRSWPITCTGGEGVGGTGRDMRVITVQQRLGINEYHKSNSLCLRAQVDAYNSATGAS